MSIPCYRYSDGRLVKTRQRSNSRFSAGRRAARGRLGRHDHHLHEPCDGPAFRRNQMPTLVGPAARSRAGRRTSAPTRAHCRTTPRRPHDPRWTPGRHITGHRGPGPGERDCRQRDVHPPTRAHEDRMGNDNDVSPHRRPAAPTGARRRCGQPDRPTLQPLADTPAVLPNPTCSMLSSLQTRDGSFAPRTSAPTACGRRAIIDVITTASLPAVVSRMRSAAVRAPGPLSRWSGAKRWHGTLPWPPPAGTTCRR